jgi:hypothetical protein
VHVSTSDRVYHANTILSHHDILTESFVPAHDDVLVRRIPAPFISLSAQLYYRVYISMLDIRSDCVHAHNHYCLIIIITTTLASYYQYQVLFNQATLTTLTISMVCNVHTASQYMFVPTRLQRRLPGHYPRDSTPEYIVENTVTTFDST